MQRGLVCYDCLTQIAVNAITEQCSRWSVGLTHPLSCYRREYNKKVKEVVLKSWVDDSSAPETAEGKDKEGNSGDRASPPPSGSKHKPELSAVASPARETPPQTDAAEISRVVAGEANQEA